MSKYSCAWPTRPGRDKWCLCNAEKVPQGVNIGVSGSTESLTFAKNTQSSTNSNAAINPATAPF